MAIEAPVWWRSLTDSLAADPRARGAGAAVAVVVAVSVAWVLLRPDPPRAEDVVPFAAPLAVQTSSPSPPSSGSPPVTDSSAVAGPTDTPARMVVHAAGAVRHPGVYELDPGARVADLVAAAGGGGDGSDLDRLNLAEPLVDGSRVYVPMQGEEVTTGLVTDPVAAGDDLVGGAPSSGAESGDPGPAARIDLNLAAANELESLPGIGPAIAAAIIEHRSTQGPFRTVDDLLAVPGIGEAKLAAVRDRVTVGSR